MPKFSYKVRDREDRVVMGTMEAVTSDEVLDRLTQKALLPIMVKELLDHEINPKKSISELINDSLKSNRTKVPYRNVVFFHPTIGDHGWPRGVHFQSPRSAHER